MFLMFGLGSKKPWESLVFRFWGFGGGVWRLCSLPVDWSRYWHSGRERPCARELGFDRPEPVAKALVSVGPVCVAFGGSVLPMLKPQNLVRFPVLGSEPHAPRYCQNCVFWEPPIHRRQRRESFRGVPHEPFLCDDSDSGFRIVPLVMPRKRRCFRQTFPASAQAIHQAPLIFLLGIFLLERRLMAEMQLGRWGPFCVTARGRFLSLSSPISAFGGAVGWSVF